MSRDSFSPDVRGSLYLIHWNGAVVPHLNRRVFHPVSVESGPYSHNGYVRRQDPAIRELNFRQDLLVPLLRDETLDAVEEDELYTWKDRPLSSRKYTTTMILAELPFASCSCLILLPMSAPNTGLSGALSRPIIVTDAHLSMQ